MGAIEDKVAAFTPLECVEKLREEVLELDDALKVLLIRMGYGFDTNTAFMRIKIRHLFQELADVHVTGYLTLSHIWPDEAQEYDRKINEALTVSIPEAVEKKREEQMGACYQCTVNRCNECACMMPGDMHGDRQKRERLIQSKIRQNVADGKNPGEGMDGADYDAMAGYQGSVG